MTIQRFSSRPSGVLRALGGSAIGTAWFAAGMLATGFAAAAPPEQPHPKIDCASIPATAPLPAECKKAGPDSDSDAIADASDGCPAAAEDRDGFEDDDGCPDPDNDGDGALDEEDGCPLEAEDRDGFKDADGCAEPDNDGDGVLDARDVCPLEPESFDGSGDGDGCPELLMVSHQLEPVPPPVQRLGAERPPTLPAMPPKPVTPAAGASARAVTPPAPSSSPARPGTPHLATAPAPVAAKSTPQGGLAGRCPDGVTPTADGECLARLDSGVIQISETIHFAHRTETLLEKSHPVLDQVVDILDAHPELRVMIVGHADGRGDDQYNLRLSTLRAMNVRSYLLQQSRSPQQLTRRLEAVGIGSRQPIGSNESAVGRSKNRRVEFLVSAERREPARRTVPAAAPAPAAAHAPAPAGHH